MVNDDMVRLYEMEIAAGTRKVALDGKPGRPLSRYFAMYPAWSPPRSGCRL